MFESITQWFHSLDENSHLFNHSDDQAIHIALASVLYHIINEDHKVTSKEVHDFKKILMEEFDLKDAQAEFLKSAAESASSSYEKDLETVNHYLKDNPVVKMHFMEKLIHLISIDGVLEDEMSDFYKALHVIFPEIRVG
ncbi:TerB family tellurite resistance protein [Aliikangiella sp. G2MR2-5]|uniref:TerB family tellurite resistance protein n=1 Tax=Aliikangiella sp. G2MR2-5 TaxID=2788943 RepID=UPI0018AC1970|nr:TerB family tellurite resistance protein [Aliikangiella sp. G2MR2-5]